ncbi:hypothetical protein F2Q70_00019187 [Brassica cretica]|uniref:Uncharacterized protein n=4 Tax=Brassica TaxID=3705 RepID=A0A8S9S149_BRACR|nr:hypothetical protein F2Q70_00019187 [Brassica cretica]KAF3585624.1 hypothetical protein F2Q69_00025640 [Brassica cretica]KAG2267530.1 hypothetical protein Bca52824_062085 [Brassica carinata]VDD41348.1 unnamed protein product [Brassica oleracea]
MASIVLLLTQILHPTNLEFPTSSSSMLLTSASSSSHYTQHKSPRPTTVDTIKMSPLHEDPQDSRVMIDFF